jgi:hypothetical protein
MMTQHQVPAQEVLAGDVAVGVAGFRPITRVTLRPRKRVVEIRVAGTLFTFPYGHAINVRRRTP